MMKLQDQVAIVTGASKGIGRAISLSLAREGAAVVCMARTKSKLDELMEQIRSFGGMAMPIPGDVTVEADVERVVSETLREFGKVDILVNNAGIGILALLGDLSTKDYDLTMDTHMKGTFLFSRAVVKSMIAQHNGYIVNIASISGLKGFARASVYCASKFAVIGFSRSLDLELREHNIKVCAICPAGVDTDWAIGTGLEKEQVAGLDRLKPETIADAVLFAVTQPKNSRVTEIIVYPMVEEGHQ
ncbi:MAG: SDR family oxidoreductase [Chloroflexi bacterium]|nr:SDR family oxidoreductase [Chloroflexota bacterium]MCL5074772.1 SDR family oxidoreductase [Chloroflexota bacterium]